MASVKRAVPGSNYELPRQSTLVISGCDFVQMFAKSIDVREDAGHNDKGPSFTDTDISRGGVDLANRGLERIDSSWLMAGSSNSVLSGLEDVNQSNPSHEKNWDQFEANKKLFGVESNFDESLYTTRLDKSAIPTEKQLEAAKLARGIEQTKSNNPHISEERGQGTALDEEALYGAVLRSEVEMTLREPQETRYIPPAHRSGAIGSLTQPLPWKPAASAGTVQAVGDDQDPEGNAEDAFDGSASEESAPDITDLLGDYDPTDRTGTEVQEWANNQTSASGVGKSSLREEMSERLNKTEHEKKGSEEVEEVVSAGFQRPSGVAVSENKSTEILSDKGVSSTHASEKTVVVKKEQQFKLNVNAKPFRFNAAAASFTPKAAAAPATSSTSIPSGNGGVPVPAAVPGQLGPAYGGGQYLSGPGGVASGMYMGPPGALIQPRGPRGPVGYERPQPIGHQPRGPQSIGYEHGGHLPHGVQARYGQAYNPGYAQQQPHPQPVARGPGGPHLSSHPHMPAPQQFHHQRSPNISGTAASPTPGINPHLQSPAIDVSRNRVEMSPSSKLSSTVSQRKDARATPSPSVGDKLKSSENGGQTDTEEGGAPSSPALASSPNGAASTPPPSANWGSPQPRDPGYHQQQHQQHQQQQHHQRQQHQPSLFPGHMYSAPRGGMQQHPNNMGGFQNRGSPIPMYQGHMYHPQHQQPSQLQRHQLHSQFIHTQPQLHRQPMAQGQERGGSALPLRGSFPQPHLQQQSSAPVHVAGERDSQSRRNAQNQFVSAGVQSKPRQSNKTERRPQGGSGLGEKK